MTSPRAILLLPLLVSGLALNAAATTLQWGPCKIEGNKSIPISCATLEVPRDYLSNGSATITLNLAKLSAKKQPSKGTVLYNPGGPGFGGRNLLYESVNQLFTTIGPYHDIVSWDPRGTGVTLRPECFTSSKDSEAYALLAPPAGNASDVSLDTAWAVSTTYSLACAENAKEVGELIGTAYTARDMMRIVDALGEDGLLRYYGQSYGTFLGQTAAAMFPDRVDKIVVDGVLNPTQYRDGKSVQQFESTDAAFEGFLAQCIAKPDLCPLARFETPDQGLSQQIYAALELLKTQPIIDGPFAGNIVGYGEAKKLIVEYIYGLHGDWYNLGVALDMLLSRNTSVTSTLIPSPSGPFPADSTDAYQSIRCGDTTLRANSLDEIRPLIEEFYDVSDILGDYMAVYYPVVCTQWPFRAKEVYSGDFKNIKTRNPILFIGNTFDPITSMAGARNGSSAFVGSRLLVENGYGHSSWGQWSRCTVNAISAYFLNGTLPEENTQCQPDADLFNDPFWSAPTSRSGGS